MTTSRGRGRRLNTKLLMQDIERQHAVRLHNAVCEKLPVRHAPVERFSELSHPELWLELAAEARRIFSY